VFLRLQQHTVKQLHLCISRARSLNGSCRSTSLNSWSGDPCPSIIQSAIAPRDHSALYFLSPIQTQSGIVDSPKKGALFAVMYIYCPPQKYLFIWDLNHSQYAHKRKPALWSGEIIYCVCAGSSTSGLSSGLVGRGGRNLRTTGENRLGLSWRSLFRSLASPQ
jgi:hypothetical protein